MMLELVKTALRIKTDAFDTELNMLINAAFLDLTTAGVDLFTAADSSDLVKLAVCTFCKANFGDPDDADRIRKSYDMQKAQLSMKTGYTDWGESDV